LTANRLTDFREEKLDGTYATRYAPLNKPNRKTTAQKATRLTTLGHETRRPNIQQEHHAVQLPTSLGYFGGLTANRLTTTEIRE